MDKNQKVNTHIFIRGAKKKRYYQIYYSSALRNTNADQQTSILMFLVSVITSLRLIYNEPCPK